MGMSNLFLGALADGKVKQRPTWKDRLRPWLPEIALRVYRVLRRAWPAVFVLASLIGPSGAEPRKMVDLIVHVRAPTMLDAHLAVITMTATNLGTRQTCDGGVGNLVAFAADTTTTIACKVVDSEAEMR